MSKSGPAGALIAYAFVGTIVYSVMVALGEMATFMPVPGAFTAYASRFVDPSLGFAMGWVRMDTIRDCPTIADERYRSIGFLGP